MSPNPSANDGEIFISHLKERVDANLLSETDPNRWRAVPYRTETFDGVMLGCGDGDSPAPLTVRLGVTGRYDISIGMYSFVRLSQIRLRLSGDVCCTRIGPPPAESCISAPYLYEFTWKQAEVSGQDLILEAPYGPAAHPYSGGLAYIRLRPAANTNAAPESTVQYPLAITSDGYGIFGEFPHHRPEDLLESFEALPRDNSIRLLLWGTGAGDNCSYPTRVGRYIRAGGSYWDRFMQVFCDNMARWKEKGWNSLEVMRDYAQRRGWEFQTYIRMECFQGVYPFEHISSDFFRNHPECHCFDTQGQRVGRLSYAYPEVQEYMLRLIRELSNYRPDGVCLAFNRGIPVVLYEPIMVDGFTSEYGLDPRELDELDPRWMEYQSRVFTPFIEQAKRTLQSNQRLSVIVPGNQSDCMRWGLNVAEWVEKGLVDDVFPIGQRFTENDVHIDGPETLDFEYFNQLTGRERIRLFPMLYPWDLFRSDPAKWHDLMLSYLTGGADGYAVWDAMHGDRFPRVDDVGHRRTREAAPAEPEAQRVKLLSVGGFRYDRYHYFEVV